MVRQAVRVEAAGFERLWISDHFHPWNDEQGQSPFVWTLSRKGFHGSSFSSSSRNSFSGWW
ncbi:MAG: hypothetical protein ACRDTK_16860, partial [Mycobacterium sp.]